MEVIPPHPLPPVEVQDPDLPPPGGWRAATHIPSHLNPGEKGACPVRLAQWTYMAASLLSAGIGLVVLGGSEACWSPPPSLA